ncbi:butanol dehydrogenase [Thioflexithrix psekupsensis]|uniref:Cytochrome c-type protein n=1 Tax=Thioflexithrix psekupsensis TaxID=1570016 RepID=A0A251X9B4_9GAMM|nr:butanol dehydrogenase [Thioflexithrix psekupsensis]
METAAPAKRSKWRLFFAIFAILLIGGVGGIGFTVGLEYTNTTEFCVSCHSMQTNYEELKQSMHWSNASGVHAGCADCHVPKEFFPKMHAKIIAAKDVWHEIMGTIDTPEKYEARRWQMANMVWDKMMATDSRECRTCHSFDHMDLSAQDRFARNRHERAQERGQTCIECHRGIVHTMPDEPEQAEEAPPAEEEAAG